jgi:hypothetical protein
VSEVSDLLDRAANLIAQAVALQDALDAAHFDYADELLERLHNDLVALEEHLRGHA